MVNYFNFNIKAKKSIVLLTVLLLTVLAIPFDANAHTAAYLAVTVDTSSNLFVGSLLVTDEMGKSNHPEVKQHQADNLTFPSDGKDMSRVDSVASDFANNLVLASFNSALLKINNGSTFSSVGELKNTSRDLINSINNGNGSNVGGYTVNFGKSDTVYMDFNYDMDDDGENETLNDDCYITLTKDGVSTSYVWKMQKYSSFEDDTSKFIDWEIMNDEAWGFYELNITSTTVTEELQKPNIIAKGVTALLSSLVYGLQSILGLLPIQDLVFNEGFRDTSQYVYGIFPTAWMGGISLIFMIFQAIAWITILVSIISIVFRKNISSISSSMRVDVMISIQKLIFAGLLLALLFPIVNIVLKFSYLLTDIFSKMMTSTAKSTFFASVPIYGNSIASAFAQIAYFIAMLTINIMYIIRGVVIAVLIAVSPLFIVFMTLGDSYSKITMEWLKVFLSNLFIQPINALVLGFLMSIPLSGIRGIEALVYVYAMIPISETIRQIIFQNAGSNTSRNAGNMTSNMNRDHRTTKTLGKGALHLGAIGAGLAKNVFTSNTGSTNSDNSNSGSAGGSNAGSSGSVNSFVTPFKEVAIKSDKNLV